MFGSIKKNAYLCIRNSEMVPVVQLVRASDCGSECRGFESHRAPSRDIADRQCLFCEKSETKRHRRKAMSFFVRSANRTSPASSLRLDKTYLHPIVLWTDGEVEPVGTFTVSLYQQFVERLPTLVCYI